MLEVLHQNYHMQGFTTDGKYCYWSFTDSLVKTTMDSTVVAQVPVFGGHMGDIDYFEGRLYATVLGNSLAGRPWGVWTSFHVYVYDAESLAFVRQIRLDTCYDWYADKANHGGFDGVDGIAVARHPDGRVNMMLAGGLVTDPCYDHEQLLEYDLDGNFLAVHRMKTGNTVFGIQNLDYDADGDCYWLTAYSPEKEYQAKETLFRTNTELTAVTGAYHFYSPYGFEAQGNGKFLASHQGGVNRNRAGYAYPATLALFENGPATEDAVDDYLFPKK